MENIDPVLGLIAATISLVVPAIMWTETYVIWRANRAAKIAALRQLLFSSACRATAVTIVAVLILDNLWGFHVIEGTLPRIGTTISFLLLVAPSVRFLVVYFNRGFRTEGDAVRIVEKR